MQRRFVVGTAITVLAEINQQLGVTLIFLTQQVELFLFVAAQVSVD